jgi:SAM-dependent methyltransferase
MSEISAQCLVCFSDKTVGISDYIYKCRSCGIAFNTKFSPKRYDDNYFLSEYRRQYGKTYIEDYDAIYTASKQRIKKILKFIKIKKNPAGMSLFDIGAAAGFFLKCARDSGLRNVAGIEISEYASKYCRHTFNISVIRSSFDDFSFNGKFDIITAWFFIEHCENPGTVIKKIYSALNRGGVFAFSGPSIQGPLFRFNRMVWIRTHPTDHRIDFSPRFAARVLKKCGFRKIHVRPAGFHPERIISSNSIFFRPFSLIYSIYSRLTAFSDTIEVYAVK